VMRIFMKARGGGTTIVPATTCTLESLGLMRPSTTHNCGSLCPIWFKIYATCSELNVNIYFLIIYSSIHPTHGINRVYPTSIFMFG
jgi:hypothetical protein